MPGLSLPPPNSRPCSLFPAPCSLFPAPCSLFPVQPPLDTPRIIEEGSSQRPASCPKFRTGPEICQNQFAKQAMKMSLSAFRRPDSAACGDQSVLHTAKSHQQPPCYQDFSRNPNGMNTLRLSPHRQPDQNKELPRKIGTGGGGVPTHFPEFRDTCIGKRPSHEQ